MRIFLAGATGFIGSHILHALSRQGYEITCLVRPKFLQKSTMVAQPDALPRVRIVHGEWTHPQTWLDAVAGHNVVINAVGIIRASRHASFSQVHTAVPCALFEAAAKAGVNKIVQISALGADEQANSSFHRSKRMADQYLKQMDTPYVILRPSFIYGPGDHSMALFSRLTRLPLTPVPGDGSYRVQPLHVQDLVRAVLLSIERQDLVAVVTDIGGSEVLTFNAMLDLLARQQGKSQGAHKVHIPWRLMSLVALMTDLLGGYGPITTDELNMLRRENFTPHLTQFVELFGFEPMPFSIGLAKRLQSA